MTSLAAQIPAVYFWLDTDKSMQYAFEVLDAVQQSTLGDVAHFPQLTKQAGSTQLVKEWLEEVGNPFLLDSLSTQMQQKLVLNITTFYAQRGTLPGLVNAITFFFHETPVITMDYQHAWTLGQSALGVSTKLLKYTASSLKVRLGVSLDNEGMKLLTTIVEFFKPLHMDWVFEEVHA